jgi:CRISPR-associated protein Cas5d
LIWIVDRVRILNRIQTEAKSVKPLDYVGGGNSLAIYTYLKDVRYQIQAHFEWNQQRDDLRADRIDGKHQDVAKRSIARGGRRDVYLGTRECQAYVTPCRFGYGAGYYDEIDELPYGLMFHGFDYPNETGDDAIYARFYHPIVKQGVIEFPRPDDPSLIRRKLRPATALHPEVNTSLEDILDELD